MTPNSADFSVIIQGPILGYKTDLPENQLTKRCISSIKMFLPQAEIIISTWIGQDASDLAYDTIIFNDDPGAITYNDFELNSVFNNINRQIYSTINGLKASTRKYSIKMRGDFWFENAHFLSLLKLQNQVLKYRFFEQKIIVSTYFFRNPEKLPQLFHISDLFQIGLTSDLIQLWSIPFQPEPQTTRAFEYQHQFANDPFKFKQYKMQYASEQYIWHAFAKSKNVALNLQYFCQIPFNLIYKSTLSLLDNFIVLSPKTIGINFPDRLYQGEKELYTEHGWNQLYESLVINKSGFRKVLLIIRTYKASFRYVIKNKKNSIKQFFKSN